ncbi:hypothetical protein KMD50_gp47 [Lactococcus phage PLgW-1]|uniref:Uncharacterized protein n=3 Tax=Uwajimavirus PLgW1 TaxID=2845441 RepID=A0A2Z2P1W5_9CAUD|nr:hypothetical protein KMD50_gp47 [Lactococcus phage PLgW-1]ARQ94858.1 hypothetical protein PLgW1_47 [Lactococcus phage PLgW-1]ASJ80030.1 hypothetical protein [Lactococcus phage PLgY-16]ASJ80083.1 hypothetical protein [Lactococcus phage PLgY-30]
MKDFLMMWLFGTVLSLIAIAIAVFICVVIWIIVSELGIWTCFIIVPVIFGLMLAVTEL